MSDIPAGRHVPVPGQAHGISFGEAFRVWLKIALLSFCGPAGQIAVMHRVLVEEELDLREPVLACYQLLHTAAGAGGAAT